MGYGARDGVWGSWWGMGLVMGYGARDGARDGVTSVLKEFDPRLALVVSQCQPFLFEYSIKFTKFLFLFLKIGEKRKFSLNS